MNFDFSIANTPMSSYPSALRMVYCVYADRSYNVLKYGGWPNKIYVALRTIGGLGRIKIEGFEEMPVPPDTIAFFDLNDIRNYYCAGEHWDFWWFEFTVDDILDLALNQFIPIQTFETEMDTCKACLEYLGNANVGMVRLASAVFSELLCRWGLQIENVRNKNPYRETIENVINHMKANLQEQDSIKNMAQVAGLCERRFRHVFEQVTGMQPKKYQDALRISMAKELLVNTPLSIQEISLRLGYSSQFHFSKAFRSINHMPPSKYRNSAIDKVPNSETD